MIKEPEVPEIAEYYVISHPTRGYARQSIYVRPDFTKSLQYAQLYSSLYEAEGAFRSYKNFSINVKIKKLTMCVD